MHRYGVAFPFRIIKHAKDPQIPFQLRQPIGTCNDFCIAARCRKSIYGNDLPLVCPRIFE